MPYVTKDANGNILAVHREVNEINTIWVEDDDPDLVQVPSVSHQQQAKSDLELSDLELIRVIDDLVELLIKKQVFAFTELPEFAQQKLGKRQKIRKDMTSLKNLISDENEEGIF
jgi:hypothetical protein